MPNKNVGTVEVDLIARDARFSQGMRNASKEVDGFSKAVSDKLEKLTTLNGLMKTAGAAVGVAAAAFATATAIGFRYGKQLDDIADSTGLTAAQVATFHRVAINAGVGTDGLVEAVSKLNIVMGDAQRGNESAVKALDAVGLSWEKLAGLDTGDRFLAVAQAIGQIPDQAVRASVATDLLGKSSAKILALTENIGEQISQTNREYGDNTEALNEATKAVAAMEDAFRKLWQFIQEKFLIGLSKIAPAVKAVVNEVREFLAGLGGHENVDRLNDIIAAQKRLGEVRKELASLYDPYGAGLVKLQDRARVAELTSELQDLENRVTALRSVSKGIAEEAKAAEKKLESVAAKVDDWMLPVPELPDAVLTLDPLVQAWSITWEKIGEISQAGAQEVNAIVDQVLQAAARKRMAARTPEALEAEFKKNWKDLANDPALEAARRSTSMVGATSEELRFARREDDIYARAKQDPAYLKEEALSDLLVLEVDRRNQAVLELERQQDIARLSAYGDFSDNLATLTKDAADHNKVAFYANKAFQMASAEINAWIAYSNTLAIPDTILPIGVKEAMAATALAAGQVAVAHIAATGLDGARAMGGPVGAGKSYLVGERGPEVLRMGGAGGSITPNNRIGGDVVVNVINHSGQPTSQRESSGPNGERTIDVIIGALSNDLASGGRFDSSLRRSYPQLNRGAGAR